MYLPVPGEIVYFTAFGRLYMGRVLSAELDSESGLPYEIESDGLEETLNLSYADIYNYEQMTKLLTEKLMAPGEKDDHTP